MRNLLTYCLIIAVFSTQIKQLTVYIDFKINQDFIAAVLCINQDKPELECHGQCHLSKQLQEIDHSNDSSNIPDHKKKTERNTILYFEQHKELSNLLADLFSLNNTCHIDIFKSQFESDIFHPPKSA